MRWQVRTLEGHTNVVFAVSLSRDGTRIASGSGDSLVKVWDVETGAEVSSFVGVRWGEAVGVFCGFMSFPAGFALDMICGEGRLT